MKQKIDELIEKYKEIYLHFDNVFKYDDVKELFYIFLSDLEELKKEYENDR